MKNTLEFDVDEKLINLLSNVFNISTNSVVPELTKDDVGSWDSLKQMDLVTSIEREFDLTLDIPDIIRMTSVKEIAGVLQDKGVDVGLD